MALNAGLGFVAQAQNSPAPQVTVNGRVLRAEAGAFIQNGRVLVPMRDIFESLEATVNYNSLTQQIAAQRGTTIVRMSIGSNQASVNNVPVMLESAARSYGGRTYVPLRFVSEALGAQVNYNAPQQLVSITGQGYKPGHRRAWARTGDTTADESTPEVLPEVTSTKLYVGNLSYQITDEQLNDLFAEVGNVVSAQVVIDRYTGESRGFGFVEMGTLEEAAQAIAAINGRNVGGRKLVVNESKPREGGSGGGRGGNSGGGGAQNPGGGSGGRGGGGFGGGGGRDGGEGGGNRY